MVYLPHTDAERRQMLQAIGVETIAALFEDVPERYRYPALDLPDPLSELEALQELRYLSDINLDAIQSPMFLGAGAYRHWVPSVVDYVISRGEFATAYTPYQPEVSQGTLQAIFEYQSMICDLTGMDVANASHYDGATATAEAVIQAYNVFRKKRKKVMISAAVHPHYREVVRTYTQGLEVEIIGDEKERPISELLELVDDQTACVILQTPNFLGELEDLASLADEVHTRGQDARKADRHTLLVVVTNPISLGLLKPPGDYGADIVVGEGQPLGLGLNFGGPYLGIYATREEYVRELAGRLIGKAVDVEGKEGFVMTLTTREQHIRRARATSNICTNQGLMALAATVYMAALGKHGLRQVAELNYHKAHYAADRIDALKGFSVARAKPFFNEFVVRCPVGVSELNRYLLEDVADVEIIGGYDLSRAYPQRRNQMLVAVTEMNSQAEIDMLVDALAAYRSN